MAEYKKLSQLIEENNVGLKKQLVGKVLPVEAELIQQLCVNYVGSLTSNDSIYMNQLSLLEQDLLKPVIKVMDTLYASDMELSKNVSDSMKQQMLQLDNSQQEKVAKNTESSHKRKSGKEYAPAMVGAAGGTIIGSLCKPGSWGVILLGSVISAIVGKVLYDLYVDNRSGDVVSEVGIERKTAIEYKLTASDVDNILRGLASAGDCVDKVLKIYRNHIEILQHEHAKEKMNYSLDKKYGMVLECLQTVLGNLQSSEETLIVKDSIKQIVNALANQGYKVVHYSEKDRAYFEESIGECDGFDEFMPAILKSSNDGGNAVLKGRVLISNK